MQSVCILDGDQTPDLNKYIITLPGAASPEEMIMNYSIQLFDNDDPFWTNETILNQGFGKVYYQSDIRPDIDGISAKLQALRDAGESTHGKERELRKKVFQNNQRFFEMLFKHWVNNDEYSEQINKFSKALYAMFRKAAEFHGINPNEWVMK